MTTEKKELKRCIIIAENVDDVKSKMQKHQKDLYKPSNLSKFLKDKNQPEFVDPKSKFLLKDLAEYAFLIEDDNEYIGQLFYAALDSSVLQTIVVCKDPVSALWFLRNSNSKPVFVSLDFRLTAVEDWQPITQSIYNEVKLKWQNIPVVGITSWEATDFEPANELVNLLRKNSDSVYDKSTIWEALPNIFKDKYQICVLTKKSEELHKKLTKVQKDLVDLKKTLGIDLKTRIKSPVFAKLQDPIIGDSFQMNEVRMHAELASKDNGNVLLLGETGTGKELVAKAIHELSGKKKEIVIVNCAAIPEALFESELFGVVANYPGFHNMNAKIGFFEQASGGTLFLDEIHHLTLSAQAKVLRAIDDRKFYKLGGEQPILMDSETRIIAASKPNIEELITKGLFLEDLFGRLNSFMPIMPPLRERMEDLLVLKHYFLEVKKSKLVFTDEADEVLKRQPWKRNVRELRNFIFGLHNLYSGDVREKSNLGTIPRQILIEPTHIEYALTLHNKIGSNEVLLRRVIAGPDNSLSDAEKKSNEPSAKKLLNAILSALTKFTAENNVMLDQLCKEIIMPGRGNTGTAKQHLSTEFNRYKNHFKDLMSSPEFSDKLQVAMKYSKLKKILTT
jgi:DNA-binding NtrC family response regulator